jgi:IPT/TIG domain
MVPRPPGRRRLLPLLATAATLTLLGFLQACGGSNPAGPTPPGPAPSVTAVAPNSGSTLGGTKVTVTGTNFTSGVVVTFGGVAATSTQVVSSTQLTTTTGEHASGAVDVVVSVGAQRGTLPGAFTFVPPSKTPNESPTITSLKAQGSREDEPAQFADLGEEITVTATVTDEESSPDSLTYEWTADIGTLSGTGRAVKWRAPTTGTTPATATLTLVVVEKYQTTNDSGLPVTAENRVTKNITVSVHDSVKEVGDMATEFLTNFSKSEVGVDTVMKDFTPSCSGTADERRDVEDNRHDFIITSYTIGPPTVRIDFDGRCPSDGASGDACSDSRTEWHSTNKNDGKTGVARGIDHVAAVFRSGRWWLCSSHFEGVNPLGPLFIR